MCDCMKLIISGFAFFAIAIFAGEGSAEMLASIPDKQLDILEVSGCGQALTGDSLGTLTGRQNVQIDQLTMQMNNMKLNGQVTENTLYSTATGMNSISHDAFTNATGIATVIQNSGNQVVINNSLILNLYLH